MIVFVFFVLLAGHLAIWQKILEDQYCMTDCCDPIDPSAYETNGKCWDCRGTGHAHGFVKDNGRYR